DDCAGGQYMNQGYYDYVCYTSTDCQYLWRNRYVWVGGDCSDGHYEQQCSNAHYEPGLCYPDQIIAGICIPGRYWYFYPYGTWRFHSAGTPGDPGPPSTPDSTACDPILPAQAAVAQTGAKILSGPLANDITDDSWRAAVQNLAALQNVAGADYVDALLQIIDA